MFSATTVPVTPWNVPTFLSATSHLAMTQLPDLATFAMGEYLREVRRLNYGLGTKEAGAGTVRSATLFSPYGLLFGFKPKGTGAGAQAGIQTVYDDWALDVEAVRGDDYFSIHPGTTTRDIETVVAANIGATLLAAGHVPQMALAWKHVRAARQLKPIYDAAEAGVMSAQADRMLSGGAKTRFDLLAMGIDKTGVPNPTTARNIWNLCRLMIVPPEGHCAGYAFQFPGYAEDDGWEGRADLCTQLLAIGAARLIGLDHIYDGLTQSHQHDLARQSRNAINITTRQFGDAWLIGVQVLFEVPPKKEEFEPPVVKVGDKDIPLALHQFERLADGFHRARFAAAHRLDLRPDDHKLDLTVSWLGREEIRHEYNYSVPDRR